MPPQATDYALRTVCTKTVTPVRGLDWTLDSKYLACATRGMDLVYLDAASGKVRAPAARVLGGSRTQV